MVKKIPLTQGKYALVDDEDYDLVNQYKWHADYDSSVKSSKRFYVRDGNNRRMHRVILNTKKGEITDHINGNGLDNRRSNLRIVTQRQNCQNKHIKSSSKYPGVSWDKTRKKWVASIHINRKKITLGRFKTEIDAFEAYCNAINKLNEKLLPELIMERE